MNASQRIVLFLFVACLVTGAMVEKLSELFYRLAFLWFLVYVGSWAWAYFSLRSLRLTRSARTLRAQVGQIFEERFEVQNLNRLPRLWMEVQDESPLPGVEGSRVLTMIEGYQGRSYLARTRLMRRGAFPLGPTVLSSGDLFGLFPSRVTFPSSETLLVYPMMVEVPNFPNPAGLLPGGEALRRKTLQVTPNAAGVREYFHGDPLNRIHWISTARRNRLMVKEFELDPLADVWIFLDGARTVQASLEEKPAESQPGDFWQREFKPSLPPSTEEYMVSIAASLARYYLRRGRAVGLVASGQSMTVLPPDRGGRQLGKILEALSLLRCRSDVLLRSLVEMQAKHITRGSTVVVVTPSVRSEVSLMIDHLMRRGLRPVLVLLEASSFGGFKGTQELIPQIQALGAPLRLVRCGDTLELVLSEAFVSSRVKVISD